MTIRHSFAASTALVAIAIASPALAAQEMSYEQQTYEFAQPLPVEDVQPTFTSNPVVQPIPSRTSYPTGYDSYDSEIEIEAPATYHGTYDDAGAVPGAVVHTAPQTATAQPLPVPQAHQQMPHTAYPSQTLPHQQQVHAGYPQHAAQQQVHGGPPLPSQQAFDRSGWLDNCEAELRARMSRGAATGGILGAIAGGVIGNRVADSERLGGTLLGAGIGGIAGAAIGSAIGSAVRGNPYLRECKAYLENWERGGYQQGGYAQHGGYYGQQAYSYAYVPALAYVTTYHITRPVVREYVTEEWVDVPVEEYEYETVVEHKPVRQSVRYIKQKPVRQVKYIKGQ